MNTKISKFTVKKDSGGQQPHRVLSVVNLTAADFIPLTIKDKSSKYPVIKPKIMRRKSEFSMRRPDFEQPEWMIHYKEQVKKQLKQGMTTNDLRQKRVTFSFCEYLQKKEAKPISKFVKTSPAKYQD